MSSVSLRPLGRAVMVLCVLVALVTPWQARAQDGVDGDTYVSPTFGYTVEWDDELWSVEEESSEDGYDLLVLETDGSRLYIEGVYFYQGDPEECLDGEALRIAEEYELEELPPLLNDDGEPVGGEGDDYVYAMYELPLGPDTDELDSDVYLECRTLVPNSVVLIITGFLDPFDLDAQAEATIDLVEAIETEDVSAPSLDESDLEQLVRETGRDIDAFWADVFDELGEEYADPLFITFTGPTETECGDAVPGESGSFYCPADRAVYLDVEDNLTNDLSFGVVFFQVVLAHEIGHHVQELLGLDGCSARVCGEAGGSIAIELQADCFAGAWTQDAMDRDVIAESDMARVEAGIKAFLGDPIDTPEDDPDAHGTGDQRFEMFMAGFDDGVFACGLG